jgi:hypothetical protein
VLTSFLVIPAYFCVRLIPRNEVALHLGIFDRPLKKEFIIFIVKKSLLEEENHKSGYFLPEFPDKPRFFEAGPAPAGPERPQ